jgi:hypothetical protein
VPRLDIETIGFSLKLRQRGAGAWRCPPRLKEDEFFKVTPVANKWDGNVGSQPKPDSQIVFKAR